MYTRADGPPEYDPAWGFADLHNHQFSSYGFAGRIVAGDPFHTDFTVPIEDAAELALSCCGDISDDYCPSDCVEANNLHGGCGYWDLLGNLASDSGITSLTHDVSGYPEFQGWPHWYTTTHQQVYVDWLERAWRGGLRLMVMEAVDNEVFCELSSLLYTADHSCDQMESILRQIAMAYSLELYIDYQDDGNYNGSGFYEIAQSATEAREILDAGKLVVVLGVEVSSLFNCYEDCSASDVEGCRECDSVADFEDDLDNLQAIGVRHLHVIHEFDNVFGGAAVFDDLLNIGNYLVNGEYFSTYDCSEEGYEHRLPNELVGETVNDVIEWFAANSETSIEFFGIPIEDLVDEIVDSWPEYDDDESRAHCNSQGLTSLGESFIELLMDREMIIDVDHMSLRARDDAYAIIEPACYPVVSSHSSFQEVARGSLSHEQSRLLSRELDTLREVGGIVAPITRQGQSCEMVIVDPDQDISDHGCIDQWGEVVTNDCSFSTRVWAQVYLYAVEKMKGQSIALGTDFNGPTLAHLSPRFGETACFDWDYDKGECSVGGRDCKGECEWFTGCVDDDFCLSPWGSGYCCNDEGNCVEAFDPQDNGDQLEYPFAAVGCESDCEMPLFKSGNRTFDFNTDGLAHVGMLPDMIADLVVIGVDEDDLYPLVHSAEAYVAMWERIEGVAPAVFVDDHSALASNCGAGTPENPYLNVELAIDRVKAGGDVVIAPGSYELNADLLIDKEIMLWADGGDVIIGGG